MEDVQRSTGVTFWMLFEIFKTSNHRLYTQEHAEDSDQMA